MMAAVFLAMSLVCALVPNIVLVDIARALQGVGAAGVLTSGAAILADSLSRTRHSLDHCGHLFFRDVSAGEDNERLRWDRHRIAFREHRQPLDERDPAALTQLLEPARMQPREAESLVPGPRGETLGQPAEAAGGSAEVLQPVLPRPYLEPVDDNLKTPEQTCGQNGKQRRVKRRRLHDVVAPAVGEQMAEDIEREAELDGDAPPAVCVEVHGR